MNFLLLYYTIKMTKSTQKLRNKSNTNFSIINTEKNNTTFNETIETSQHDIIPIQILI